MAGMAFELFVGTVQGRFCLSVMIEDPQLPAIGVVACAALAAQTPFMVCILMAIGTLARGLFEGLRQMAFFAGHHRMQAYKREARQVMVKGNVFAPTRWIMAFGAFFAELPLVHIILLMAAVAAPRLFHFGKRARGLALSFGGHVGDVARPLFMAAFAGRFFMFPCEGKAGVLVVIKNHGLPFVRLVAGFALGAELAIMSILQGVTADAGRWQVLVAFVNMAGFATHFFMAVSQGKFGFVMVIGLEGPPHIFVVAKLTFLAELASMWFLFFVAGNTLPRRIAVFFVGLMTV